jgi:hypothetical protein
MGTCSEASFAVSVKRGSTVTTFPPRSRMARSFVRTSGVTITLPCDTTGFAPMQRKKFVRSRSGTGYTATLP